MSSAKLACGQMSSAKLACALPWRSWFGEANPARSAMFFPIRMAL